MKKNKTKQNRNNQTSRGLKHEQKSTVLDLGKENEKKKKIKRFTCKRQ